ncbi:MAG: YciI family protein [Candidatus Aquilonibacter sp.]
MRYIFHLFADEAAFAARPPEELQASFEAYMAYTQALKDAGVYIGGERLRPVGEATQVRVDAGGKTAVLDGPYAESKEQLAGYYMIDTPNLDEAIKWAARCPGATHGTVEVRAVWEQPVRA